MVDTEELKKIVEKEIEDEKLRTLVFDIVVKIDSLPPKTRTTFAELIEYDPRKCYVEPLEQGRLLRAVFKICKMLHICLESEETGVVGLPLYCNFVKGE